MSDQPPPSPPNTPTPRPRGLLPLVFAFVGILLFIVIMSRGLEARRPTWNVFIEQVASGQVSDIFQDRGSIQYKLVPEEDARPQTMQVFFPGGSSPQDGVYANQMHEAIAQGNAIRQREGVGDIDLRGPKPESFLSVLLPQLLIFALLIFAIWFFIFRRMGQGGGVLSFGKSRATLVTKGKAGRTFKDVAGIDEAKDEVEELVAFLRNPRKFQRLGGRIPRGVLLIGPPGTGKTLLAKAIAGEADVPFYSISGSDFVEMFVGVGASRVRDLFQQAKDNSPCIIFMDEIDAVARRRGSGVSSGGHDEREQTLNAILVEMDGFASNDKVIVIAATNRVDVLDPALTRPGRFDRHIQVNLPDISGREQILRVHAAKVKTGRNVDLNIIARGTPGFSGADLENLINEAALQAARFDKDAVEHIDMEYARDRVAFGKEKKTGSRSIPEEERRVTAYHEAGHALIQVLLPECDDLHKVTIIPRGNFLGASMSLPKDRHSVGRRKITGDICVAFGGRLAEEIFCDDITAGAKADLDMATRYARAMVYELGMSERMGPVRYTVDHEGFAGNESVLMVSEQTRRELDQEVRRILDEQYERARGILTDHRDTFERIAKALLEYETLDAAQVAILVDGGQLEPRVPTVAQPALATDEAERVLGDRGEDLPDLPLQPHPA